jgi:class I fructose-bisphosphate aldolase
MGVGKKIRLNNVFDPKTGKTIIVPMDHGVSSGPIAGITNIKLAVRKVKEGGANAVVIHKGNVRLVFGEDGIKDIGLIVHLSASTDWSPTKNDKVLVGTVEEALKLGADMVSIHVNIGAEGEKEMLRDFGLISKKCEEWDIPLLAMIYARGPKIENQYDVKYVAHCARLGAELGADVVKVPYTGSPETFEKVVEGAGIPVVIAGGPKMKSLADVLKMVEGAIKAGAKGLSIGRNVFQAEDPAKVVKAMKLIVHDGKTAEEALEFYNSL